MPDAPSSLCKCGHPKVGHYHENTPMLTGITLGPCHATVYTKVGNGPLTSGMNATRCKCRRLEPVSFFDLAKELPSDDD